MILTCSGVMGKWTQVFLQCCVLPFWVLSLAGQQSCDYSDSEHPSRTPWYLTHTCILVKPVNKGFCQVAQTSVECRLPTRLPYYLPVSFLPTWLSLPLSLLPTRH